MSAGTPLDRAAQALDEPHLVAAVGLLRRTGCKTFGIRYQDDEEPVVWLAVAEYGPLLGNRWDAAAGRDPLEATLRLCEQLVDGGQCKHCGRPTGFEPRSLDTMPGNRQVCWYQYDPGTAAYVRGCA